MQLTCPLSGVKYNTSAGTGSATAIHPIFQLSLTQLIKTNLPAFTAFKLSTTDQHLFGSALLQKLPIERWEQQLASPASLAPIWHTYIHQLSQTAARIDGRIFAELPLYAVTKETHQLKNLGDYLLALNKAIDEATSFSPADKAAYDLTNTTNRIYEIVRNVQTKARHRGLLPQLLANWAAMVGEFPLDTVTITAASGTAAHINQKKDTKVTLRTFWKDIIVRCVTASQKRDVSLLLTNDTKRADIEELLEHCEQLIPYGSLHADILFKYLRDAIDILQEFRPEKRDAQEWVDELIKDDKESKSIEAYSSLQVQMQAQTLSPSVTITSDGMQHLIESKSITIVQKPAKTEPRRNEFPNGIAYLKAKMQWAQDVLTYSELQKKGLV